MISIVRGRPEHFQLLTDIGKLSYRESHSQSAEKAVIDQYLDQNYDLEVSKEELGNPENIYQIIYHDKRAAGYSKIILSNAHAAIQDKNITKLERLYLLKEFYGLKLGLQLFTFNLELSKQNSQAGMWLYVWKENRRAVSFYEKAGFRVIGSYDFKITETHSNPNHQMFLKY